MTLEKEKMHFSFLDFGEGMLRLGGGGHAFRAHFVLESLSLLLLLFPKTGLPPPAQG